MSQVPPGHRPPTRRSAEPPKQEPSEVDRLIDSPWLAAAFLFFFTFATGIVATDLVRYEGVPWWVAALLPLVGLLMALRFVRQGVRALRRRAE